MEQTANLQLPYIMPSQAQKHVTHNEAVRAPMRSYNWPSWIVIF